jgi:hypothetical protein
VLAITTEAITSDIVIATTRAAAMGANIASQTRGGMVDATIGFTLVGMMPLYAWVYSFWTFTAVSAATITIAATPLPETMPAKREAHARGKFSLPPQYLRILIIVFAAAFAGALIQPYYLIYLRARFDIELYMLAVAFFRFSSHTPRCLLCLDGCQTRCIELPQSR